MPPRARNKRGAAATSATTTSVSSSSSAIIAPGGGTAEDLTKLSHDLGLPFDAVSAIMNCRGQGVKTATRTSRRSSGGNDGDDAATTAVGAAMSNVWGDFLSEEMSAVPSTGPDPSSAPAEAPAAADDAGKSSPEPAPPAAAPSSSKGPRAYVLPIPPRARIPARRPGKPSPLDEDERHPYRALVPAPGLLAQTGTLDSSIPGRSSVPKPPSPDAPQAPQHLERPTLLFPASVFSHRVKIALVATSPTACHSLALSTEGEAYAWGRNETGQLGLGCVSPVVVCPAKVVVGDGEEGRFVGAGVGKYHSILVGASGAAYGSGGNKCGQLGVNNAGLELVEKFRKCVVVDGGVGAKGEEEEEKGEEEDDEEGAAGVKIVQASCGENISALLCSKGHLYTTGSSEWGQLGNGETGEYIVTAGRLSYANCSKFLRRSNFVQSEQDALLEKGGMSSSSTGAGKAKIIPLEDSRRIRLATISCGKNHILAVEAASTSSEHVPRVFSWGCGDYGRLGHTVQADEYTPRMIGAFRGPLFANNPPVEAIAGSTCSLVRTKHGHVYYFGKHRTVGEATMRPTLVDALANNGHVVTAVGAGSMTVFCCTTNGVTVSWGHGNHGELGYGKGENKSSSKPKFVNGLDSCLVTDVACGMAHTLFMIRNEDEEDAKALKKVATLEMEEVAQFIDEVKSRKIAKDAEEDAEPPKKKSRGKAKKN